MIFKKVYEDVVLRFWKLILFFIISIVILLSFQIKNLAIDASSETLILENDKDLAFTRLVNKRYYSPDFLVIAYAPQRELFDPKTLKKIKDISEELLKLERVSSVNSVLNAPLLQSPPRPIAEMMNFIPTLEDPKVDLDLVRQEFLNSPIYKENLVSLDFKTTAILVNLKDDDVGTSLRDKRSDLRKLISQNAISNEELIELNEIERLYKIHRDKMRLINEKNIQDVRSIIKTYQGEETLFLGGLTMISNDVVNFVKNDLKIFGVSILIFIILALLTIFRQFRWVLLPIITCMISVITTSGILGLFGWEITVISSNYISLQLIFTMAIVVHLIVRYRELSLIYPNESQKFLLIETTHMMIKPCLFIALTTIVGFSSLVFSGLLPVINFGWMMSVAIMISLFMSFLLFPIMLISFNRLEPNLYFESLLPLPSFFAFITEYIGKKILWISLIFFAVGLIGICQLKVENSFIDYFKNSSEIYKGMKLIDSKLGGTTPLDIIIDFEDSAPNEIDDNFKNESSEKDDFTEDEFDFLEDESGLENHKYWFTSERMELLGNVHDHIASYEEVGNVTSFATMLKVGKIINGGNPLDIIQLEIFYKGLPTEYKKLIIDPFISIDDNQARISARIKDSMPNLRRAIFLDRLKKNIPLSTGIQAKQVKYANVLILYNNMLQSLFKSQILTIGTVLLLLLLMFLILFRSIVISIIALFPNILSISLVLGFMGWVSIPLDMMTITIAAISMGIAVDNTIHYIYRFRSEVFKDFNYVKAMQRTHKSIGYAMYYTSITIIVGFSILIFSNFIPSIYFGLLTGLAMFFALLASLTLLPQLLIVFKPYGIVRKN